MGGILGQSNIRKEMVWRYSRPPAARQRQMSRVHDTICWYSKSKGWTFNVDVIRHPYVPSIRIRKGYAATASKVADRPVRSDDRGKCPESWVCTIPLKGNSAERVGHPHKSPWTF